MRITINEAISYFDEQCPNMISFDNKVKWLSELDEIIFNKIIRSRENPITTEFSPYTSEDGDKQLLVPSPYTEIYRFYLEKMLAIATVKFNSVIMLPNYLTHTTNSFFLFTTQHIELLYRTNGIKKGD